LEGCFEFFVFTSLKDTHNRDALVAVRLVLEVLLGNTEAILAFLGRGSGSNPHEDGVDCVDDEDVGGGEALSGKWNFLDFEGAGSVRNAENTFLFLEVGVVTSVLGGLDGFLATECVPEELGVFITLFVVVLSERVLVDLASTLVIESLDERSSLSDLTSSSSSGLEGVKVKTTIINENVSEVKRVGCGRNLTNDGLVQLSLDVEETRNELLRLHVLESGLNTSGQDFNLREESEELVGFLALNFTVLDWETVQEVVELDSLVGSGSCFVLGGVLSQPEVDIVEKLVLLLVGVEDDVTVS
jgi:hypothetical protein